MGLGKMMKQMQKVQGELARMQEELQERTVAGSSGGGAVQVTVNGKQEVCQVKISPEVVDPDDVSMLEDLVMAAVNEALRQCQEMVNSEMGKITGGLKIPGL
ncbi:MAG: YbaB/EbfC family nucleoid-associated protein [Clostridia bacterium]|nr:MAG: YbaB/EbfC family nucleoid-associated protein [Clostridia bacterium]